MPCAFHAERPYPFGDLDPGCQFKVQENQLTEVDGETWCHYHLPLRNKDKQETQKAQWNYERIEQFNKAVFIWIRKAFDEKEVCDLTGTVFPGDIDFSKIEVFPPVSFFNTQFSGDAEFAKARFSGTADFREAQFSGPAWFRGAQFSGIAEFEKAQFSGDAEFWEAQFSATARFIGAQFSGTAWFKKAQFSDITGFRGAQFSGSAEFGEAQFSDTAGFRGARFSGSARFGKAQFNGNAGFEKAQFSGAAEFEKAQFSGDAEFQAAGDTSTPEAIRANTFHWVTFENVVFSGPVSFLNRQFLDTTNFKGCVFNYAPAFHNCALHQGTNFRGTQFLDTTSEGSAEAYRTLKLAMENVRARQEEAMFYALEQQSLRARKDTPWSTWAVSHLYHLTASYGQSFIRPLGWLLGITVFCFLLYATVVYLSSFSGHHPGEDLRGILDFTMEQLVRPFSVWSADGGKALKGIPKGPLPLVVNVIATFQSIFSLSLLALFLLALRRRFKMG